MSIAIIVLIILFVLIIIGIIVLFIKIMKDFSKKLESIDDIMQEISTDNQD